MKPLLILLLTTLTLQSQAFGICRQSLNEPQSAILTELQEFAEGKEPDFNDAEQMAFFHIYRIFKLGDPTTQLKSNTDQLVIAALKANPGSVRKERFHSVKMEFKAPLKLSEEMTKTIQQTKQNAQIANGKFYNATANSGFWNKVFENVPTVEKKGILATMGSMVSNLVGNRYKQFLSEDLIQKLESESVSPQQKATLLFQRLQEIRNETIEVKGPDFAGLRNLSQVMVDMAHAQPFLNKDLANILKSADGMVAIETFEKLLAARDLFVASFGIDNFSQLLVNFNIKQPSSLSLPNEKFIAQWQKMKSDASSKWSKSQNENNFSVRQMSVAESIFRSCVGGNECSSRTYPTKALDPNYHYFTMTDNEAHSTGNITVVLGKGMINGKEEKVAFLDKMQNVPAERIAIFVEGVRQSLLAKGYQLVVPKHLGENEGLTNSTEVRAFFATYMGQENVVQVTGFTPSSHNFKFENLHSRAESRLPSVVIGALSADKYVLTSVETKPFYSANTIDLKTAAAHSYKLKDGHDAEKILYIKTQEVLKTLKMADPEYAAVAEKWLNDTETSFAVKKQVLLASDPEQIIPLAQAKLNDGEKLRFFTAVVASPFYREMVGVDRIYKFLEENPAYLQQLSTQNLSTFSISRLIKYGQKNIVEAVIGKVSVEKINKPSRDKGNTPIGVAASRGELELVKSLEAKGADLAKVNEEGRTPLMRSLIGKHTATAEYIVDRLTDEQLNVSDAKLNTAVYYAIKYEQPTVLTKLLQRKANPRFLNLYDQTESHALIAAIKTGQANLVQIVLATNPELKNEPDLKGNLPMRYAQKTGSQEIIALFADGRN